MRNRSQAALIALALVLAASAASVAQTPDRSRPPAIGSAPALVLPTIQKRQLSNGLGVWIVEHHDVPVVQVNLVVRGGSAGDPVGQYGIASLTAAMLVEGAGGRSSLEIADAIDFLGASLSAASGVDAASVRLYAPVARLASALPVMADVALRPTFPADELERLRKERLTSLLQARDDPATIASLAFSRVVYGAGHRFGTASMGTEASIKAFTPDQLRSFYRSIYRPERATLLVVGDVRADTVTALLETTFGGWKAEPSTNAGVALPAPAARTRREVYLVDKPGSPQSPIRIGGIGVPRATPDYFPLQILNTVLGGSFTSRLNLNLREKRGYTYGAGSVFDMREAAGTFLASADVQTDKTAEALTEFFAELNGILEPVPPEELASAKNYVALRFPGGFETTGDISRRLEEAFVYRLPDHYFSRYVEEIQSVTAADVQRVARRYIQPDRFAVVVVGERRTIEPRIREMNLGPISVITIDELFAPAR
jgi:predicted Zn-dependent peptidase